MKGLDPGYVESAIRAALDEDRAGKDATVSYLGITDAPVSAAVVCGEAGVLAGTELIRGVFRSVDERVEVTGSVMDGDRIESDQKLWTLFGPGASILAGERVALNFVGRMSGVATLTARFVKALFGTGITLLDTRKTTPLWRDLEKYAVRCGGGENHRRDLQSMVLIKENHRRVMGGRDALLARLREHGSVEGLFVEVEVDTISFLKDVLKVGVDRVMLDNFTPGQVEQAVQLIAASRVRPEVEVSGGINLGNISDFALAGVDYISVGGLTHSASSLTLSLEVDGD